MSIYVCADCAYADLNNTNWKGYVKCVERLIFVDPRSKSCYRAKQRETSPSGGCYITTALCNILNLEDDCIFLRTLRNFRDKVMVNNNKYIPLLMEYDIVGPVISKMLYSDANKEVIANNLLRSYIIPACTCINNKDYDGAVRIYTKMTNCMKRHYGINDIEFTLDDFMNIDYNTLGKARRR